MRAAKFILFKQASDEFNWSSRSKSEMMKNWNWKSVGGTVYVHHFESEWNKGIWISILTFRFRYWFVFLWWTKDHFISLVALLLRANCDMGINKYRVVGEEKKERKKERKKIEQKIVRREIEGWKITLLSCIAINRRNAL